MRGLMVAMGLSAGLIATALLVRSVLPEDETRYLSVAWEMNWRGDFLVAHMSGELYSHKPPILFWLINLAWFLFGEQQWIARCVAPLAGLACIVLVFDVARKFWPTCKTTATLAPIILCSSLLWMVYLPTTMFDTLVSLSLLIAVRGMQIASNGRILGWLVTGLAIGFGLLAKGPVILLFVVTGLCCLGWIRLSGVPRAGRMRAGMLWMLGSLGSILVGAVIILSWAIPSAMSGGKEYATDLFLGQSTGRIVQSFAHQRPIYWFLPFLPVCLLPWIAYPPTWRIFSVSRQDRLVKMLLIWIVVVFILFSLISGKQLHYILPLAPLLALAIARTLASESTTITARRHVLPVALGSIASALMPFAFSHWSELTSRGLAGMFYPWSSAVFLVIGFVSVALPARSRIQQATVVAGAAVLWVCTVLVGSGPYWHGCNIGPLADTVHSFQEPVGWYGDYQAQLNYMGQIKEVASLEDPPALQAWIAKQQSSCIVVIHGLKRRRLPAESFAIAGIAGDTADPSHNPYVTEAEKKRWEEVQQALSASLPTGRTELLSVHQLNKGQFIEDYFVVRILNF